MAQDFSGFYVGERPKQSDDSQAGTDRGKCRLELAIFPPVTVGDVPAVALEAR